MNNAIQILGERLAKGEITPEEFKARLAVLKESATDNGAPASDSPRGSEIKKPINVSKLPYFDRSEPITLGKTAIISGALGALAISLTLMMYAALKLLLVDSFELVGNFEYYSLGIWIALVGIPLISLSLSVLLVRRPSKVRKPVRFGVAFAAALTAALAAYLIVGSSVAILLDY